MKKILGYLEEYWKQLDKRIFAASTLFTAIFIFINYYWNLNHSINGLPDLSAYAAWALVFLIAFGTGHILHLGLSKTRMAVPPQAVFLLLTAPLLFAWKMIFPVNFIQLDNPWAEAYWNRVLYWPFKLAVIVTCLFIIWKLSREKESFYGVTTRNFDFRPYGLMLLLMIPLIAAASTQPDFLYTYPKLKQVGFIQDSGQHLGFALLYELSYGSDFFTIELFFRGFLVLAFCKWMGYNSILPMAMFYCTIHFGKPLGECISSYFGGIILGVVTYHTRSILGGLMVHVGIAWLMEIGGWMGSLVVD